MSFLDKLNPFGHGNKNPLDPSNAIHAVENAATKAAKDAVGKIEDKVKDEINELGDAVLDKIKSEIHKVEGELEDLIVKGLLALAGEAMKPGLALGAKIARKTDSLMSPIFNAESDEDKATLGKVPFVLPVTAGVVSIGFYWYEVFNGQRLHAIAASLDQASHNGIHATRGSIISTIKAFGPDHIDIGVGVKFSLGVQFGVTPSIWSIPTKYFLRIADKLLEEAGVPA